MLFGFFTCVLKQTRNSVFCTTKICSHLFTACCNLFAMFLDSLYICCCFFLLPPRMSIKFYKVELKNKYVCHCLISKCAKLHNNNRTLRAYTLTSKKIIEFGKRKKAPDFFLLQIFCSILL